MTFQESNILCFTEGEGVAREVLNKEFSTPPLPLNKRFSYR